MSLTYVGTCNACIFKIIYFFKNCLVKARIHVARLRAKLIPVGGVAHPKPAAETAVLKNSSFFLEIFSLLSY